MFFRNAFWISLLWLISILGSGSAVTHSPTALYLSWDGDPTTSMVVHWLSKKQTQGSEVLFRKVGEIRWLAGQGERVALPDTPYAVHRVRLVDLSPGTDYEFQIRQKEGVYRFRTMPQVLSREIRWVVGGDAYSDTARFRKMNRQIQACDPDFVVVGGDLAYAYGRRWTWGRGGITRWRDFLRLWKEQIVGQDGRLIPMVPVIGNHDVKRRMSPSQQLFFRLFAGIDQEATYRVLDFGNYLSLWLLDTGHICPVAGTQTAWLEQTLRQRGGIAYKMAAYHIGAYPSVYPYQGATPQQIRKEWSPLFEQYGLKLAFEHHNHAYKRTYPIREEHRAGDGVVYMGDGSWGTTPRQIKNEGSWYLEKTASANAVCIVRLNRMGMRVEAMGANGAPIDAIMMKNP